MIEQLITNARKMIASIFVATTYVLFLPTAFLLETIALIVWFITLLGFAIFDDSKQSAFNRSWINKFPVIPKVLNNKISNARMWADSLNNPPNYKENLTISEGFASIHKLIIIISGLFAICIILMVLDSLNLFKGWGLMIATSLFSIGLLVIRLEKNNAKKQRYRKANSLKMSDIKMDNTETTTG